jgi:tetratricopeptide (TPR) repeat protein
LNNLGLLQLDRRRREAAEVAFHKALIVWEQLVADRPAELLFALGLATSCNNLGDLFRDGTDLDKAIAWYTRTVKATEPVAGQQLEPAVRPLRWEAFWHRAEMLTQSRRYPEALRDWERALELAPDLKRGYFRLHHALTLARSGDHAAAAVEIEVLVPKGSAAASSDGAVAGAFFEAARVYALCAAAAKTDAALAESYSAQSLALLEQARTAGYFGTAANREKLAKEADLDSLRMLPAFKQFRGSLE